MKVSFIIVTYNGGENLSFLLEDLKNQSYPHKKIEILLVDSNSTDNTKEIMNKFLHSNNIFKNIKILDNYKKILPCGWNIALKEATGDIILRVDAHSRLPKDFIEKNVINIKAGEKIVGGQRISIIDEKSNWQRLLLQAETSIFGSGIAKYRRKRKSEYVNTLAHAAYSREVFDTVGNYDERLARTEDNEIHYRMKKAGYKFLLDPSVISYHNARNKLSKMCKQKFLNGYWIGLTIGVQPKCFSLYHFVPLIFVLSLIAVIIVSINFSNRLLLSLMIPYISVMLLITVKVIIDNKFYWQVILLPFILLLLHLSYGFGTVTGIINLPFWLKNNKEISNVLRE